MITLYKRNAQGKPLVWRADRIGDTIKIEHGLVGKNFHNESILITAKKHNELESRIKAKRKEGYKELSELKDGVSQEDLAKYAARGVRGADGKIHVPLVDNSLLKFLNTYLPKYSTTSEGFVLPMLAKVLEDNKPFEKYGNLLGQWKIDGLRCIIGAEENKQDLFNPINLTYHSRTGEDWTPKMKWMDEILLPLIKDELLSMMIDEGACLDGELYLPGYSVNDINSFVKNTQLPQHYKLQYWCYDICCENMSAVKRNELRMHNIGRRCYEFTDKYEHLNNKSQCVLLPTIHWVNSIDTAERVRNKYIDFGFEGLILRNPNAEYQFGKRNQAMFKFKKIDDGKFIIIDIKQEHKRSDLPLFVLRNDINDELFECSINKSQDIQREMLINKDKYIGKYMLVEFRNRSGVNQVPFHARGIDIKVK